MLTSNSTILPLVEVSVKSGEGHSLEATAPLPLGMSIAPRLARLKVTTT